MRCSLFEEGFEARVSALWNTQNVGPQIGAHWANTFISAPIASNGKIEMRTPPADLLVYFAPQPGWRMQVADRTADDPRPGPLRLGRHHHRRRFRHHRRLRHRRDHPAPHRVQQGLGRMGPVQSARRRPEAR